MRRSLLLFGEAEKGQYGTPIYCKTLPELVDLVGIPSKDSLGIHYAVQSLLYERDLYYIRVREEGFSKEDYLKGLQLLKTHILPANTSALFLPGVGDAEIIEATTPLCHHYKLFLIMGQQDLYDFLTH